MATGYEGSQKNPAKVKISPHTNWPYIPHFLQDYLLNIKQPWGPLEQDVHSDSKADNSPIVSNISTESTGTGHYFKA